MNGNFRQYPSFNALFGRIFASGSNHYAGSVGTHNCVHIFVFFSIKFNASTCLYPFPSNSMYPLGGALITLIDFGLAPVGILISRVEQFPYWKELRFLLIGYCFTYTPAQFPLVLLQKLIQLRLNTDRAGIAANRAAKRDRPFAQCVHVARWPANRPISPCYRTRLSVLWSPANAGSAGKLCCLPGWSCPDWGQPPVKAPLHKWPCR